MSATERVEVLSAGSEAREDVVRRPAGSRRRDVGDALARYLTAEEYYERRFGTGQGEADAGADGDLT